MYAMSPLVDWSFTVFYLERIMSEWVKQIPQVYAN